MARFCDGSSGWPPCGAHTERLVLSVHKQMVDHQRWQTENMKGTAWCRVEQLLQNFFVLEFLTCSHGLTQLFGFSSLSSCCVSFRGCFVIQANQHLGNFCTTSPPCFITHWATYHHKCKYDDIIHMIFLLTNQLINPFSDIFQSNIFVQNEKELFKYQLLDSSDSSGLPVKIWLWLCSKNN